MDKEQIIAKSRALFLHYGYSKVTTDEIAKRTGISKKTLYNYFNNKEELLAIVIDDIFNTLRKELNEIINTSLDYPKKLRKVIDCVSNTLSKLTTYFLEDIQLKMPEKWKDLVKQKDELIKNYFGKILNEGIDTGYVRTDVNKDVVMLMLQISVEHLFDPNFIQELPRDIFTNIPDSNQKIFDNIIKVLYHGILKEDMKDELI